MEGRISLHGLIRALRDHGKTIVLASHDMAEVEALCDRIAILRGGQIVFCGTVAELTEQVGRRYEISIRTDRGERHCQTDDVGDALLKLLEDYRRQGAAVLDVKVDRGTLEQHFIDISGRVGA